MSRFNFVDIIMNPNIIWESKGDRAEAAPVFTGFIHIVEHLEWLTEDFCIREATQFRLGGASGKSNDRAYQKLTHTF